LYTSVRVSNFLFNGYMLLLPLSPHMASQNGFMPRDGFFNVLILLLILILL